MTEAMQTPEVPQKAAAVETPAPAAAETEKEPLLPDGIGLSIESVRDLLVKIHDCKVSLDDPVLMVVTMLNAYLGEVQTLQKRHEAGLSRLMTDKTDDYMKGVKEAVKALQEGLSSASVEGIKAVFNEHDSRLKAFKSNLSWLAAITACSAIINVIAFVLMGVR
ncbi:hypothetical protein LJC23_00040 [Desulfovibrio sp. OttesenSCG-928-I05]|nr:hypothetical protein [Desulfovibrio sp. OttesenSCG-928-O18]MDL2271405.1 hypothetical protein [Desulfovibrio sp. OttesenSCG-928-I05]